MKYNNFLKKIKSNFFRILSILAFTFLLFLFPSPNIYFQPTPGNPTTAEAFNIELPSPPPIPMNISGVSAPGISAQGVIIVDLPSNMVIYQKNAHDRFKPASTTKLMTALVALDHYQLDNVLTVGRVETEERTMGLAAGEKMTFEFLLYGALVHSANDAAYTIAENYPGGVAKFVEVMNQKAALLHLDDTHFTNPVGFDDNGIYTTPVDLAKLARISLNNPMIAKVVGTRSITVHDIDFNYFHALSNVNELLGKIAGVSGVKTGYTENGGEILVTEVRKNGRMVLFVLLKSSDRFKETTNLIDWVFNNFAWKNMPDVTGASQQQ